MIAPGDADYDTARGVFYGKFDRRPAAIVRPADAGEVASCVVLARETGLPLAVRGGGHSVAGHSTVDDGLLLDMRSHEGDRDRRGGAHRLGRRPG